MEENLIYFTSSYLSGALLLFFAMVFLYITDRRPYLKIWAAFWCVLSLAYIALLIGLIFDSPVMGIVYFISLILALFILHQSSYTYLNKQPYHAWRLVRIIIFCVLIVTLFIPAFYPVLIYGIFLLIAIFFVLSGLLYFREKKPIYKTYGIVLFVMASLNLLYPFVINIPGIGYVHMILSGAIGLFFGFGMIALHAYQVRLDTTAKQQELYYMSYHDKMTDLHNRAYLESRFQSLDQEGNYPLAIIMIDLNSLKELNDQFGHAAGDEMIRETANVLSKHCSAQAVISRYGGDEFIIVLPKTPQEDALEIAENLKLEALKIHVKDIPVSLSYGVASKHSKAPDMFVLMAQAEKEMYDYKKRLRNKKI